MNHKDSYSASYAAAGVDITAGYKGVQLMKEHVMRTMTPGVVSDIGGFGGLFAPDIKGMEEPVLVSGTDGVGTKQRIAQIMDKQLSEEAFRNACDFVIDNSGVLADSYQQIDTYLRGYVRRSEV